MRESGSSGRLAGRVAIVTGSGRGIGRGIAERFAAEGARVCVATRTASAGEETVAAIHAAGGEAFLVAGDVGRMEVLEEIVGASVVRWGGLDIVVHNAAAFPFHRIVELPEDALEETLAVNLKAAFRLARLAVPYLERSRAGRLLFTSSVTGPRTAIPGLGHYAASKAGLNGFIRAAGLELARKGITVNGVEPGLIRTPALLTLGTETELEAMRREIPLGRFGEPAEIACAMLFLASDEGSYVTGQTIIVDGGGQLPENSSAIAALD